MSGPSMLRGYARLGLLAVAITACNSDSLDPGGGGSVASVIISPQAATVAVGASLSLNAEVLDASGQVIPGRKLVWASSDATIATVSAAGIVTGVAVGTVQIAASAEGKNAIAEVTVNPTPVASVRVSPADRSLLVGQTVQLTAEPLDAQGAVLPGRPVTFTTSNAAVATVSAAGLVTALAPGGAVITATSEEKSSVATITVASVPVASVALTPGSSELVVGQTTQLRAELLDENGQRLTGRVVTWSTSAPQIASVSSTGLVTAISPGGATISAVSEGKTGTATIVVSPKPVSAVIVSPGQVTVIVGQTAQLTTQVTDEQGNVLASRPIAFSSSSLAIATVSQSGLVTGVAPGSVTITATSEGKSGTATVSVAPIPVASVTIAPGDPSVMIGQTIRLEASPRSANGQVLTGRGVSWSSGAPSVASVSADGVVTGLAAGSAIVFAAVDGVIGTVTVTVRQIPVASVVVTPPTATVIVGEGAQLAASVLDESGAVLVGRLVGWSSSDDAVAIVSSTGRVTGLKPGSVTITASSEGKSGTATVTVNPAPVASVTVTPPTATVMVGQTTTFQARTLDANGSELAGRAVAWSSSDAGVATVSQTGVLTGVAPGTVTITATSEGKSGTAEVTVTPIPVATVTVSPAALPLQAGQSGTLTAITRDGSNNVLTGRAVTWSSSNTGVATVAPNGTVTAVSPGSAIITATSEGKAGTATVTVTAVPVASVTVSPATLALQVGQTGSLTATTRDAANNVLTGRVVSWSSSNTDIATVSETGVVTAVAPGNATITATSEGQRGTAAVTVTAPPPAPVATVTVAPSTLALETGATGTLTATTRDASNNVLTGRVVTWSSNNTSVATVAPNGVVTAVGPGSATITATSEGKTGTATITVTAPPPAPVATVSVSPASAALTVGGTQQITATPLDAQGNALTGRVVTWSTDNPGVASVTQDGLITAVGPGNTTVTATSEGKVGTVSVSVSPAPTGSVSVAPASASVNVAWTLPLTATVRDANGGMVADAPVTWTTSNAAVATISPSGVVTGVAVGTATITASSGATSGTASVTVQLAPVDRVTVTPSSVTTREDREVQLTATLFDARDNVLTGRVVTWSTSANNIARVNQNGRVTTRREGTATITATAEGKSGTAQIQVRD